jgi:hypothetical protein
VVLVESSSASDKKAADILFDIGVPAMQIHLERFGKIDGKGEIDAKEGQTMAFDMVGLVAHLMRSDERALLIVVGDFSKDWPCALAILLANPTQEYSEVRYSFLFREP